MLFYGYTWITSRTYHIQRIKVDKSKVELVSSLPLLISVKNVRSFLRNVGLY